MGFRPNDHILFITIPRPNANRFAPPFAITAGQCAILGDAGSVREQRKSFALGRCFARLNRIPQSSHIGELCIDDGFQCCKLRSHDEQLSSPDIKNRHQLGCLTPVAKRGLH
jgi:hypothetical protein